MSHGGPIPCDRRATGRQTLTRDVRRSGQTYGCRRSGRTKDFVTDTLRRHGRGEVCVSVVGDPRDREMISNRSLCQRKRTRSQRVRTSPIARFENGSRWGIGLRRLALRVLVRARAGPIRISGADLLAGVMTTLLLRSHLSGRLHEDSNGAALQQHRSRKQEDKALPPSGTLEWTGTRGHRTQRLVNGHPFQCCFGPRDRPTSLKECKGKRMMSTSLAHMLRRF